jgi:cell envelope opacity-associated protein A
MNIKEDWTDNDWEKMRVWLKGVLQTNPVSVTFTKKDGTERVMNCTLEPSKLPVVEQKPIAEGKEPRKESTTSLRVFDLDKGEWRSFTVKSVKHIAFTLGKDDDTI